jgi:hypothetical protein
MLGTARVESIGRLPPSEKGVKGYFASAVPKYLVVRLMERREMRHFAWLVLAHIFSDSRANPQVAYSNGKRHITLMTFLPSK